MGGAQVNPHCDAPLVRVRGLARFGNLQKRHEISDLYVVEPAIASTREGALWECKTALLSQLLSATLNIVGKSRNEHEGSDLAGCACIVLLLVDELLALRQCGTAGLRHLII